MPYTPMINSVLQASALGILAFTIEHYSVSNAWAPVEDWQAEYKSNQTEARLNQTETDIHESVAKYNLTASFEWHKTNNTTTKSDFALNNENFLSQGLPKGVFVIVVTAILRYWWMIWLERLLPARPRASTAGIAVASEKEDDSREEEVIRKWVEAGKVRRASLSWFNTFAKWFLDMTIGKFGDALIGIVLLPALDWKSPWTEFDKWVSLRTLLFQRSHADAVRNRICSFTGWWVGLAYYPWPRSSPSFWYRLINASSSKRELSWRGRRSWALSCMWSSRGR